MTIKGIDFAGIDKVAADWDAAKAAGIRFAIFRDSIGMYDDPTDDKNLDAVRARGIVAGAYLMMLPTKNGPGYKAQVDVFARGQRVRPGDFPPVLDVEFSGGIAATGMTRGEILAWIRGAVEYIRQVFKVAPMIYTSKRVWDGEDADSLDADRLGAVAALELTDCPLWLARYPVGYRKPPLSNAQIDATPWPPTPAAWGEGNHWIHQIQGDSVGLPGFGRSSIDINRFRLMSEGETGRRVAWAQKKLRMAEGTPGVFDRVMSSEVQRFQRSKGIDPDGIVGPITFAWLAWE